MPGYLTRPTNHAVLDLLFGGARLTPPDRLYFGLSSEYANTFGYVIEPDGDDYARVDVPNDPDHFHPARGGVKSNATTITFPAPGSDWGLIVSVFIADAPVGGHVLAIADLATSRRIRNGHPAPSIAAGSLFLSYQ